MASLTTLRAGTQAARFARQTLDDTPLGAAPIDRKSLEASLRTRIGGEVRFDEGTRAVYATDASNYRQAPIGVVVPRDLDDVIHAVACAREHGAPILPRGGGTSLAGQSCNAALLLDFTKYMHRVLDIDIDRKLARVEPGCVLDNLRHAAEARGLTFAPDPATHSRCTLGGMLGNNSCGVHSLLAAKHGLGLRASDNTAELSVLTYDGLGLRVGATSDEALDAFVRGGGRRGEIYAALRALRDRSADEVRRRFPQLPRRVSGYNLDELLPERGCNIARALVGTEGTCVTILEATLHLVPAPGGRALIVLGYPDVFAAADHLTRILEFTPTALEGFDQLLFDFVQAKGDARGDLDLLPPGHGWLLVEFGGDDRRDASDQARRCMDALRREPNAPSMRAYDDPAQERRIWKVREGGLASTAWVPGRPDQWEGWEDAAVAPDRVGAYLREFRALLDRYDLQTSLYGHFGQGCIHCRIAFDFYSDAGLGRYRAFMDEAVDLVLRFGGSLSGEHGDGQSRAEFLPRMFGDDVVRAFRDFKAIWDPTGRMNPGKVVDPSPITANLRLGPDYAPPNVSTHFAYPADRGNFARAALRCVGVGECRREGGGVMCPSYMATRDERHSTRGRARALWEMLNGEVITDGWRSEAVKDALDLCLSCKGCKRDCPVDVDMATYKAEFLSHYYEGRLRPRHAYVFGLVHEWARFAGIAPNAVNLAMRVPGVATLAKLAAGVAPRRALPRFAAPTFRQWMRRHEARAAGTPVVLWPDTFNDRFHPETAIAAVQVLEAAGFSVRVPRGDLCCGRPLYDYGFLDRAAWRLRQTLGRLQPELRDGTPIVVLEPSCAAVFRDELGNLMPDDDDAKRLAAQTFLLSEFLQRRAPHFVVPRLERRAIVHAHCHHRSVMGFGDEEALLRAMGVQVDVPAVGCCGMAGAFGFEAGEHFDVSMACGERELLPAVRLAAADTLLIADGFSCREQIEQSTGRHAVHLSEAIALAQQGVAPVRA